MKHRQTLGLPLLLLALGVSGCAWLRPDQAARVATGSTAHDLCSETFVSGLDPDTAFTEGLKPRPGFEWIAPLVRYAVDRDRGEVSATLAGGFSSRAVYLGERGCMLVRQADARGMPASARTASIATPAALPQGAETPGLQAAVDDAFAENVPGALRQTKAVLIVHRGQVLAERYAPGYGPATPMLGFSLGKSITNALVGLLVHDGKLRLDTTLPSTHGPVTLEQAMRMTTGLALDETGSGFDPSNHLRYLHTDDMAAFAQAAPRQAPAGRRWAYSSASTHLVSRLVRDALGGSGDAVQRFAHERLFRPLGMAHVVMEADETGTPIGAHYTLATARDWARFGQLYLNDGVAPNGQRLLPEHWVTWSTEPTLDTDYGAGWWLNRRAREGAGAGMPSMPDVPADTF